MERKLSSLFFRSALVEFRLYLILALIFIYNSGCTNKSPAVVTDAGSTDSTTSPSSPSSPDSSTGDQPTTGTTTPVSTYTMSYNGNGNLCGSVPTDSTQYKGDQSAVVASNSGSLQKYNSTFAGWNTKADGTGTDYSVSSSLPMQSANQTLYAKWTTNSTPSAKVRVFILAGQSNMVGLGKLSEAPEDRRPLTGVWFDNNDPSAPTNANSWQEIGSVGTNMGPEMGFAATLRDIYPNDKIAIVKVAQSATGLSYWTTSGNTGHDFLISRINTIKTRLDGQVSSQSINSYEFSGFIWMQGENEANSLVLSEGLNYGTNFATLVSELRTLVGKSHLPTVLGRISIKLDPANGGPVKQPQLDNTRASQVAWANGDDYGDYVDTDDLSLTDVWHFGSYGTQLLGQRFALKWLSLAETRPILTLVRATGQNQTSSSSEIHYAAKFNQAVKNFSSSSITVLGETGAQTVTITETTPTDGTTFDIKVTGMSVPGWVDVAIANGAATSCTEASILAIREGTKIAWAPHSGVSSLLAYQPFSATVRALHGMTSYGYGWSGLGWVTQNDLTSGYVTENSSSLTYGTLATTPGYAVGGYNWNSSGTFLDREITFAPYADSLSGPVEKNGTVIWMSYLIQQTSNNKDQQIALTRETTAVTGSNTTVVVHQSGGKWVLDVLGNTSDSGVAVTTGQTYLIVLKLSFGGASNASSVHMWVNPSTASLGGADLNTASAQSTVSITSGNFKISALSWYPGDSSAPNYFTNGKLDEIRFGLTYASVTPTHP